MHIEREKRKRDEMGEVERHARRRDEKKDRKREMEGAEESKSKERRNEGQTTRELTSDNSRGSDCTSSEGTMAD